jgi:putative ABC transport system ATP-binding protein
MKTKLLQINNVSLSFPGIEKPILSEIHYTVNEGDIIVILGSNGSGKSSLLKLIDKRYHPNSGTIALAGNSLTAYPPKKFNHRIKTLTQNCHETLFTSLTVLENYLLVKQQYEPNLFSIQQKQERQFFTDYIVKFNPNLAIKLDQVVEQLSGGEKQALALALTVLYPPQILLLDEHTSALDPKSAAHLMQLTYQTVQQHRITCLMTTHDLAIAEKYGNRILALKNGEIYQIIDQHEKSAFSQNHLLAACY